MKDLRMLGSMISKLSADYQVSSEEMADIFQCTVGQVEAIKEGRLFPTFYSLQNFAKRVHSTVSSLMKGDEEYYNKTVVHCVGKF